MPGLKNILQSVFKLFKNKTRLILIASLILIFALIYSRYIKTALFIILFIFLGGISKLYHRIIKTPVGIDLVFFTTLMTCLVFKNIILSLAVAWLGLILADIIGTRFSYTSVVSLIGLTFIIFLSKIAFGLPLILGLILLTIFYEIISSILYGLMGSPLEKIAIFAFSHLLFNIFLIFSFAEMLRSMML